MGKRVFWATVFAFAALSVSGVAAQRPENPPPGCRAWDTDLPKPWQPWAEAAVPLTAAVSHEGLSAAALPVGKKAALTLAPSKDVHLEIDMPEIDAPRDPHNGLLSLHVPKDGKYWIAVSGGVWIDVIVNGKFIDPAELDGGPLCASLGKALLYNLKAGDVVVQLVRARGAHIDLLVTEEP